MDDFVIPAKTMEELEERKVRFLKIVEKHNLCFKRLKYNFNMEEIPILGVVVGKGQVQMEQEKIKAVKEWKHQQESRIPRVSLNLPISTNDLSTTSVT